MKTPDEIKKKLKCLLANCDGTCQIDCLCNNCELYVDGYGIISNLKDILAYIQQLERERDAAVRDLYDYGMLCELCLHEKKPIDEEPCKSCAHASTVNRHMNWQWRGIQEVE